MSRDKHIQACINLLNEEVHSKRGLSGLALKSAYKALCAIKPNATHKVIDYLYDDFVAEYKKIGSDPKQLGRAWLEVTDQKARLFKQNALFNLYQMLRPSAVNHVEAAIPKLTQLFDQLGTEGTPTKFK